MPVKMKLRRGALIPYFSEIPRGSETRQGHVYYERTNSGRNIQNLRRKGSKGRETHGKTGAKGGRDFKSSRFRQRKEREKTVYRQKGRGLLDFLGQKK